MTVKPKLCLKETQAQMNLSDDLRPQTFGGLN